jgi:hypothetical protein
MSATASRKRQHEEGVKLMSTTQGKFVWYDLMTSDSKAAESFYRSVIGWDVKDSGMADGAVAICVGIDFGAISSVTILPHHAARSMI